MSTRIKIADLPAFDAAPCLNCEAAIAAYLNDILKAHDIPLLISAQANVARAAGLDPR